MDEREQRISQRRAKRRRNELIMKCIIVLLLLVVIALAVVLVREVVLKQSKGKQNSAVVQTEGALGEGSITEAAQNLVTEAAGEGGSAVTEENAAGANGAETQAAAEGAGTAVTGNEALDSANLMAAQYDYDGAMALLQSASDYSSNTELQSAVAGYQTAKDSCVSYPLDQVTHVFFHTLVKDTDKAFDGDSKEGGYNQVMTTISEFNSIIQQMYDKGFVMVSLHDMCTINDDGTVSRKEIYLPEGKKPFVLSQDDVSYYHYMGGDGFADKLIVDENGEVKNTYIEDDGSTSIGDYDMVPLIDTFVKEHPDFSYHGHKGILALTGYEGVLGYRTDEVYKTREASRVTEYQQKFFDENPDFDWQADVDAATAVANAMKADGWEFASHTWGHINPVAYGYDSTVTDTERWLNNVAPVVGDTDVLIFAFGADIGDWQPYTSDNQFFTYFKSQGFDIFCNVDSSQYWVQYGDNYMRQGRRNLDGYRMYYNPDMLSDLFDVNIAWDSSRPTPVPEM
ncbi:MAG: polysaccharide deacetylase [Lachnospiraceae bacterium]|nr:polysaccharide deacetylase [Lachnospiraceae bacterium]